METCKLTTIKECILFEWEEIENVTIHGMTQLFVNEEPDYVSILALSWREMYK